MTYTLTETVETVGWNDAVSAAPADLVKAGKEMSEKGQPATFAKILHLTTPQTYTWCIVSINAEGRIYVAKRCNDVVSS
jgi:hypothetical protein